MAADRFFAYIDDETPAMPEHLGPLRTLTEGIGRCVNSAGDIGGDVLEGKASSIAAATLVIERLPPQQPQPLYHRFRDRFDILTGHGSGCDGSVAGAVWSVEAVGWGEGDIRALSDRFTARRKGTIPVYLAGDGTGASVRFLEFLIRIADARPETDHGGGNG